MVVPSPVCRAPTPSRVRDGETDCIGIVVWYVLARDPRRQHHCAVSTRHDVYISVSLALKHLLKSSSLTIFIRTVEAIVANRYVFLRTPLPLCAYARFKVWEQSPTLLEDRYYLKLCSTSLASSLVLGTSSLPFYQRHPLVRFLIQGRCRTYHTNRSRSWR